MKQLSNANPNMKRQNVNDQKLPVKAVATPKTAPNKLQPISDGIRPNRSAIQPNSKPPTTAPMKNIACAIAGKAAFSHTQSSCNQMKTIPILSLITMIDFIQLQKNTTH